MIGYEIHKCHDHWAWILTKLELMSNFIIRVWLGKIVHIRNTIGVNWKIGDRPIFQKITGENLECNSSAFMKLVAEKAMKKNIQNSLQFI